MPLSSIIALAGPQKIVEKIDFPSMFDKVLKFYIPGDHGEFPDTSGYTRDDWEKISLTMEDSQLWPHMKRCMDAVLDFVDSKNKILDKLGMVNIKTEIQWPRFGGDVFGVCGFVGWTALPAPLGKRIRMARG